MGESNGVGRQVTCGPGRPPPPPSPSLWHGRGGRLEPPAIARGPLVSWVSIDDTTIMMTMTVPGSRTSFSGTPCIVPFGSHNNLRSRPSCFLSLRLGEAKSSHSSKWQNRGLNPEAWTPEPPAWHSKHLEPSPRWHGK